jgi:cytoskeletal protein RodZ
VSALQIYGLSFPTFSRNRGIMQRKTKGILSAIIIIALGVLLVVMFIIILNQPGSSGKKSIAGNDVSPKGQGEYPAPNVVIPQQSINQQAVYPPPSTIVALPTITAMSPKTVASPTASKGTLTANDVQHTPLQEAKAAFDGKKAVFLDFRASESYTLKHIPGAISIPEAQLKQRMTELDPNQWIIAYCS